MAFQKRPNGGGAMCVGCFAKVDNGVAVCESCMAKLQRPPPQPAASEAALRAALAVLRQLVAADDEVNACIATAAPLRQMSAALDRTQAAIDAARRLLAEEGEERTMATEQHTEPPFDGHPCPACPSEVRDLYAVAFNLLNVYRSNDWDRLPKKLAEFRRSVERFERIVDGHFARPEHSHPPREGYTTAQPRPAAE